MKIAVVSDYLTHHLSYFCEELLSLGNELTFVACKQTPDFRLKTGFNDMSNYEYVIKSYELEDKTPILKIINDCDFIIFGSGDRKLIKQRSKKGLLIFRYSEHLSKSKNFIINFLRLVKWWLILLPERKNKKFYLLCSSFWSERDYKHIGIKQNHMLKWGYFPHLLSNDGFLHEMCSDIQQIDQKLHFVWAGRLIEWKHPEITVEVWNYCVENKIACDIDIYGKGKFKSRLLKKIKNTSIRLNDPVDRRNISSILHFGDIFLFSSDNGEGWGAILNEALSAGCICICNKNAGSTNFLIKHGINGFSYSNKKDFYDCLKRVCYLDSNEKNKICLEAINTIKNMWNPHIASLNLIRQAENIERKGELLKNIIGPASTIE